VLPYSAEGKRSCSPDAAQRNPGNTPGEAVHDIVIAPVMAVHPRITRCARQSFPRKRESSLSNDPVIKIPPCRISPPDQLQLPRTIPFLDLFFTSNGRFGGFMGQDAVEVNDFVIT
jgi:hypothetical protein